ncbi:MAG TPA: AAA family ATPase [Pseudonocardiaceae bacterium]|nr:AAA family ATPase [Pseudonocardiaceae bacterium]
MAELEIRLLGRLAVIAGNRTVNDADLPGRQGRLAFAYLTWHRDRVVPAPELAEAVWPDDPPRGWSASLATVISRLRTVLPAGLVIAGRDGGYRLVADGQIEVDLERLRSRLAQARERLAAADRRHAVEFGREAVRLARQLPLAGLDTEWLTRLREELRRALLDALDVLSQADDPAAAIAHAEEVLSIDPYRESAYRALIDAHLADGDRGEAVRTYERCRSVLADALGVDPSPRTEQSYLRALRAGGGLDHRPRLALPPALEHARRGVFVGREGELDRVHGLLACGKVLALVTGDPGIGKTRFAAEFAAAAHQHGVGVLFGRCDEDRLLAYQPLVEALRYLVCDLPSDVVRGLVGVWAGDLSRLLPELTELLPSLAAPFTAAPDTERLRLFEAVTATLAGYALGGQLVLVIDDLHWADQPTLRLIRYLLRAPRPASLLLVGTCREGEVTGEHPLATLLADLERDELVSRIALPALSQPEVAAMMPARTEAAGDVHRLTGGNPFFVRQLVRHLDETGTDLTRAGVPPGVVEVVRRRLAGLPPVAQQSLIVAAVIGRAFDLEVVASVLDTSEPTLLADLEHAAAGRLITEIAPRRFAFTHDLVRHAVYGQIGASRRARLHGWVATALEQSQPAAVSELARHFCGSGDPRLAAKAVAYSLRAAEEATARLGYEEAARHCAAALPLAGNAAERARVLLALGEARMHAGDQDAQQAFTDAASAARDSGDRDLLACAALGVASTWGGSGVIAPARLDLLTEALTVASDDALRAQLLAKLAGELYYGPDVERRDELTAQAVAIARKLDDPKLLGECLHARTYALWGPGGAPDRSHAATEICRLAVTADDRELALTGHAWGITAAMELGDMSTLDHELVAYSDVAEQLRQPRYRWYARSRRSVRAAISGDYRAAAELAEQGFRIALAAGEPDAFNVYTANRIMIWLEADDSDCLAQIDQLHDHARAVLQEDSGPRAGITAYTAWVHAARDDETAARSLLDWLSVKRLRAALLDCEWMNTMVVTAWTAVRLNDQPRMAAIAELLLPYAEHCAVDSGGVVFLGSTHYTLGMLATALGDWDAADQHLAAALTLHQAMGARPWIARTRYEQARLAARRDRPTRALLAEAGRLARTIPMPLLRHDIARSFA